MSARTCLYCSRKIEAEHAVAMCDTCYVGHHQECWERNGRCSTFRCAGAARLMSGVAYDHELAAALEDANSEPRNCQLCGGRVYSGTIQGRKAQTAENPTGSSLVFHVKHRAGESRTPRGRRLMARLFGLRNWLLPGVVLRARSCGNCRTLFMWGVAMDEAFMQIARAQASGRYCVHCGTAMWEGELPMRHAGAQQVRFCCDTTPQFHRDWLLHNTLDRFIYNRWALRVGAIPASSCPQCRYTEVCGRPIYRFG
ncbi:MAG: hypothetical protein FJX72_16885 [Armatimonadetes bacterium]|nr:hypothetical protein [Armatimonadota bacterium]